MPTKRFTTTIEFTFNATNQKEADLVAVALTNIGALKHRIPASETTISLNPANYDIQGSVEGDVTTATDDDMLAGPKAKKPLRAAHPDNNIIEPTAPPFVGLDENVLDDSHISPTDLIVDTDILSVPGQSNNNEIEFDDDDDDDDDDDHGVGGCDDCRCDCDDCRNDYDNN